MSKSSTAEIEILPTTRMVYPIPTTFSQGICSRGSTPEGGLYIRTDTQTALVYVVGQHCSHGDPFEGIELNFI